ncbi:MAG: tetratricopeptide repeat protein, partial [Spirochaetota bacterium]
PLVYYYLASYTEKVGNRNKAQEHVRKASAAEPDFVFPHRVESEAILRKALEELSQDGKTAYYLGNLLCSRDRHMEAYQIWKSASEKLKGFSVVHRNLGKVAWKALDDPDAAVEAYEKSLECDPNDYKIICELDELYKKCGFTERRRQLIENIPARLMGNDMIAERACDFFTDIKEFDRALEILHAAHFFPWEAYTEARKIYVDANIGRGYLYIKSKNHKEAVASFNEAMKYPRNIGVGEPAKKAHAEPLYLMGCAFEMMGDKESARVFWDRAQAEQRHTIDCLSYYKAMALKRLGRIKEAEQILEDLISYAGEKSVSEGEKEAHSLYLLGLAHKGKDKKAKAECLFRKAAAMDYTHRRSRWEVEGLAI